MSEPLVSVLLLTRNGAATLPRVLAAVRSQDAPFPFEVVAVDSGSDDGTVELLRSQADRLIEIRAENFNHGTTRNVGVVACRAPLVVLLVQDAEPASADWLARLVEPLLAGDSAEGGFMARSRGRSQPPHAGHETGPLRPLAGAYARQVPRPDASAVVRAYLSQYQATGSTPRRQSIANRAEFDALTPSERLAACTFDNVCSCIRREVWERHPFRPAPIAEDLAWAREVMLAGYDLAYVPDAAVVHSHDRSAGYELKRTYLVHQQLRRLFGLASIPSAAHLVRAITVSGVAHTRWTLGGPGPAGAGLFALPRALALAVAMPLGQYLGARSADAGRELLRVRGV
ncbi:MAG: glycosyltransferase [Vicinamibacterales bacterium]